MSRVLIASITQLCVADHGGEADAIAAWTANKSVSGVEAMLANTNARFFVAEVGGQLAAVGAISTDGLVTLNYVDPAMRFRGVSKALLTALEDALRVLGHTTGRLEATATGARFYERAGWLPDGPQASGRRVNGYPMRKSL